MQNYVKKKRNNKKEITGKIYENSIFRLNKKIMKSPEKREQEKQN